MQSSSDLRILPLSSTDTPIEINIKNSIIEFIDWAQSCFEDREFESPYPVLLREHQCHSPSLFSQELDQNMDVFFNNWMNYLRFGMSNSEPLVSDQDLKGLVEDWFQDLKRMYIRIQWNPLKKVHDYTVHWYTFPNFVQSYWSSRIAMKMDWVLYGSTYIQLHEQPSFDCAHLIPY